MSSLLSFFGLDHDDTPLHCPRDKTLLQEERPFGLPMYACAQCDGQWLASAHAAKLFSRLSNPEGAVKEFQRQIEQESKPSSALCSKDGAAMCVITQRGVTLDVCTKCRSIWFDGDELEQLLTRPGLAPGQSAQTVQDDGVTSTTVTTADGVTTTTTVTKSADGKSFSRKTVTATAVTALAGGAVGLAALQSAGATGEKEDSAVGDLVSGGLDVVDVAGSLLELFDF
jgi:Zn-finger nucleic acid-binding protein